MKKINKFILCRIFETKKVNEYEIYSLTYN